MKKPSARVPKAVEIHDLIRERFYRSPENIAKLSPEHVVLLREQQEREAVKLREEFPPGKTHFSYILPNDEDYRVLDALPDLAEINKLGALRLTAGMLAGFSHGDVYGRSMVLVALHHNSRVVEYTVDLVVDKVGNTTVYEPFM